MSSDYFFGSVQAFNAYATDGLTCRGYFGCVIAGDFVFFAPNRYDTAHLTFTEHGNVLRYNRFKPFNDSDSWEAYNAGSVGGLTTKGFAGVVFDQRRYLYFVPYFNDAALRYDTWAPFKSAGSWASVDVNPIDSLTTKGYQGGAFDGRYLYLAPSHDGSNYHGRVLRYDSRLPFEAAGSWSAYDAGAIDSLTTKGYCGAIRSHPYIFFIPETNGDGDHGSILRYDTRLPFKSAGSWSAYDLTTLNAGLKCCHFGEVHDGYLYLLGSVYDGSGYTFHYDNVAARYDLSKPFKSAGSWDVLDLGASGTMTGCAVCKTIDNAIVLWKSDAEVMACDLRYPWELAGFTERHIGSNTWSMGACSDDVYAYFAPYRCLLWQTTAHGTVARVRIDPCPGQSPPSASEGAQDLSDWYEVDPLGDVYKTSTKAGGSGYLSQWDGGFVFNDFGKSAFGEVEIDFDMKATNASTIDEDTDIDAEIGILSFANVFGNLDWDGAADHSVILRIYGDAIYYWDEYEGEWIFDYYIWHYYLKLDGGTSYEIAEDTVYYCTFERSGSSSSLKIYSDSDRTSLITTLTTSGRNTADYRYCYLIRPCEGGYEIFTSFYVENLNFVSL